MTRWSFDFVDRLLFLLELVAEIRLLISIQLDKLMRFHEEDGEQRTCFSLSSPSAYGWLVVL